MEFILSDRLIFSNCIFLFGTCSNLFGILRRHWQLLLLSLTLQGIPSLTTHKQKRYPHAHTHTPKSKHIVNLNGAPGSLPFHDASSESSVNRFQVIFHLKYHHNLCAMCAQNMPAVRQGDSVIVFVPNVNFGFWQTRCSDQSNDDRPRCGTQYLLRLVK